MPYIKVHIGRHHKRHTRAWLFRQCKCVLAVVVVASVFGWLSVVISNQLQSVRGSSLETLVKKEKAKVVKKLQAEYGEHWKDTLIEQYKEKYGENWKEKAKEDYAKFKP